MDPTEPIRLGLFDLYTPTSGREQDLEDFQRLARAILGLQQSWMEWLAPSVERMRDVESDQRDLAKWIDSWKPSRLADLTPEGETDLLLALDPKDSLREAAQRYADYMIAGSALGVLSLRTRTIMGGFTIHVAVAISMDIAALAMRP